MQLNEANARFLLPGKGYPVTETLVSSVKIAAKILPYKGDGF
jgi:hypothetical protein